MNEQHPITPPPELLRQWIAEIWHEGTPVQVAQSDLHIATRAAQWGADQELEACIDLVRRGPWCSEKLRAARRPNPQTLTSIALQTLDTIERDAHYLPEITDTIRRAILRLKQLEDSND